MALWVRDKAVNRSDTFLNTHRDSTLIREPDNEQETNE